MSSLRRALGIGWLGLTLLAGAAVHRLLRRLPRLATRLAGPARTGPQRLRLFFERAGGGLIKLGQLLALQPDVLPLRYCNELYDLLDRIEPCPYEDVEAVFVAELGKTPEQAFDRFEREPLSTASIGQVHVAHRGGRKYAVKVRRPGADAEFTRDVRLMESLLGLLALLRAERFYWLRSPISEFIDWTSEELDYRQEARYTDQIHRNSGDTGHSRVPAVDWELTTRRTLVVEFMEGTTVLALLRALETGDDGVPRKLYAQGFDPPTAARNIIDVFLRDAFMHGLFHADLHPANLLLLPGNAIGYVDFGITGALSGPTRRQLARLTIAWSVGDLDEISETFFTLAEVATEPRKRAYREGLKELAADWYRSIHGQRRLTKSFTLVMVEMLSLSHRTGIMPDRAVTRFLRSAMATDGLVKRFAPGTDVAAELESGCRRYLTRMLTGELLSFDTATAWASLAERAVRRAMAGPPPGPETASERPGRPRTGSARPVRIGLVALGFAALGWLTPGDVGAAPLLVAELSVSAAASVLLVAVLLRRGSS